MKLIKNIWFKIYGKRKLKKRMLKFCFDHHYYSTQECIAILSSWNMGMFKMCDDLLKNFGY